MQIETPQNVRAWIKGFFSGSFRGNLDGTVTANGIDEVKSKNTRFMQGGELQTPELVEDGAEN